MFPQVENMLPIVGIASSYRKKISVSTGGNCVFSTKINTFYW